MWIFEFKDYKRFLRALIATFPKKGRGQARRLAEHLGVAPVVISQILTRDRHFTIDQSILVAAHFGLDSQSTEYLVGLVIQARADSKELKNHFEEKLSKLRAESQDIKNLVVKGKEELSDQDKGTFYSNWYYSAISNLCAIEGYQTVEAMADYFKISRAKVGEIIAFLLRTGMCIQDGNLIRVGTRSTHVNDKSDFVNSHRRNWRDKAREKFTEPQAGDLFYSSPVSLSKKDAELFRKDLLNLIENFSKRVAPSPEEKLMCLNIDWFSY